MPRVEKVAVVILSWNVLERLKQTEAYELFGEENIFPAEPIHGASVEKALAAAEKWIASPKEDITGEGKTDEDAIANTTE